jgi:hypothetical protein
LGIRRDSSTFLELSNVVLRAGIPPIGENEWVTPRPAEEVNNA